MTQKPAGLPRLWFSNGRFILLSGILPFAVLNAASREVLSLYLLCFPERGKWRVKTGAFAEGGGEEPCVSGGRGAPRGFPPGAREQGLLYLMESYREGLSHVIRRRTLTLSNLDRKFRETA